MITIHVSTTDLMRNLAKYIDMVRDEDFRVIITRNGQPVAALVDFELVQCLKEAEYEANER